MAEIELPNHKELEEQRNETFSKRVALVTALFAVALAITSLGGSNAMKDLLLSQQQASDQWAYYQSKVMREHIYRVQRLQAEAMLSAAGKGASLDRQHQVVKLLAAEESRYAAEKKEIEQAAKKLEKQRDVAQARDPYFDYAEVLLQIAIVMASISILASSRPVFWVSVGCALIGAALSMNGYLLLFRIPFFH